MHDFARCIASLLVPLALVRVAFGQAADNPAAPAAASDVRSPAATPQASTDIHVQAVLETNPTTPAELVRAVSALIGLWRAEAARPLVKKLIDARLDDSAASQLMSQFGPATFLQIALSRPLAPEGKAFADAVVAGARRYAQDPARVTELIDKLGDSHAKTRAETIEQLRLAGPAVVHDLLNVLADPRRQALHQGVWGAVLAFGSDAIGPLLGALESPDASVAAAAAEALGWLSATDASGPLASLAFRPQAEGRVRQAARSALAQILGRMPDQAEAAAMLERQASQWSLGQGATRRPKSRLTPGGVQQVIEIWHWDNTRQRSVPRDYPPVEARAELAAGAALAALQMTDRGDPAYVDRLILSLMTAFDRLDRRTAAGQATASLGEPSRSELNRAPGPLLALVLDTALATSRHRAALIAARLLGEQGTAKLLTETSQPAPLVRALSCPDRGVRFTALEAIVRLKPPARFAGASQVPLVLAHFIATAGAPKAVVAGPRREEAGRLAGLLAELGYEIGTATNGQELLREATASADVQLVLIDSNLEAPSPADAVTLLRNDPRTAAVPVGLITAASEQGLFSRLIERDRATGTMIRPYHKDALKFQLDRLVARAGYKPTAPAERVAEAKKAISWAAVLAGNSHGEVDLRQLVSPLAQALYVPALAEDSAQALALIGDPRSQTALVDFVGQHALPPAAREVAALAFCESVGRYGVLLRSDQVKAQYERRDASGHLDRQNQHLLSSIVHCLETVRPSVPSP
jgi:CheY-like chemotaxis protein